MLVITGIVGGALWGGYPLRRKGNRLDTLRYAASFGIAFGLAGLFATILSRFLVSGFHICPKVTAA